jgi:AraC-like DNA-binding protein
MGAFSEILGGVALKGALFFSAEFSAPWGFSTPASRNLAPVLAPGAPHLVIYHFVIEGSGFIHLEDGSKLRLEAGDVIVLPHGDAHGMSSAEGVRERETPAMAAKLQARDLRTMQAGGGGEVTRFVCGYMACDPLLCRPILHSLPLGVQSQPPHGPLGSLAGKLYSAPGRGSCIRPRGKRSHVGKVVRSTFVDTLRRYIAGLPEQEVGWLAGARDPVVGKSLMLLHAKTQHPWTIAELAKEVGLSRSALVERFTRYLAEPPMAYLIRWRLQLAARALAATSRGVAEIASDVGYESEAAFNRAFKRAFGLPPARYRRKHRAAGNQYAEAAGGVPLRLQARRCKIQSFFLILRTCSWKSTASFFQLQWPQSKIRNPFLRVVSDI